VQRKLKDQASVEEAEEPIENGSQRSGVSEYKTENKESLVVGELEERSKS